MQRYTLSLFRVDETRFELRFYPTGQLAKQPTVIEQTLITELIEQVAAQAQGLTVDIIAQGQLLFRWLNHYGQQQLSQLRAQGDDWTLLLDVEAGDLRLLPWELLCDGQQFLATDAKQTFTLVRCVHKRAQSWTPQTRQLGILFMASAPEDVQPVLAFEAEEAGILHATQHKPLELIVEESGSLQGLEERLSTLNETLDVLHLSGHAAIQNGQAVFHLENDIGLRADATPHDLRHVLQRANCQPRLLFLAGCSTGRNDLRAVSSFAEQMVQARMPVVLGWAMPVRDTSASWAAAHLYEQLATGVDIAYALAYTRQQLYAQGAPDWHLLRAYVDGSELPALVKKGHLRIRRQDIVQQFLDAGGQVRVCDRRSFVGRRRLVQRCLKVLRSRQGDELYHEGVLLYGMGGLGKSSAAARLIERLRHTHTPVVCYGGLDENRLLNALRLVLPLAEVLINDPQLSLAYKIRQLVNPEANPFSDKALLIVLDDFEQNITSEDCKQAQANFSPVSLGVLNTLVQAIRHTGSDAKVIVTSRFAVYVDKPCGLYPTMPGSLQGADLDKKLAQLPHLLAHKTETPQAKQCREQALSLGAGNPRLLERLDKVLGDNTLDVSDLFQRLAAKTAEFREEILLQSLVDHQPRAGRKTLACAALYRLPVDLDAISTLSADSQTPTQLAHAANVGLIEISERLGKTQYFVSSLVASVLASAALFTDDEHQALSAQAAQYLFIHWQTPDEAQCLELIRLALQGKVAEVAFKVGDNLTADWLYQSRYRETERLCQQLVALGEDHRILRQLARAQQSLGRETTRQTFDEGVEKPSKPPFYEIIGPRKYPKSKQAWHVTNRSIKA